MSVVIEPYSEKDTDAADSILIAAFKTSYGRKDNLRHYLKVQQGRGFVAKKDGVLVGFGAVMDYGRFAYIGLMAVDPKIQRQGIGAMVLEKILEWLDARNCPTVLLDASPYGGPLYEKYGFADIDFTLAFERERNEKVKESALNSVLTDSQISEILAFDLSRFGADRSNLLRSYFNDYPGRVLVSRDENGSVDGFLLAQSRVLGPWIVKNSEIAEKLLRSALALPYEFNTSVFVSSSNKDAVELLSRYSFEKTRTQRHMSRGKFIQRDRHGSIYGQITMGFG